MTYLAKYQDNRAALDSFANQGVQIVNDFPAVDREIARTMLLSDWNEQFSGIAYGMGLGEQLQGVNPTSASDIVDFLEAVLIPAIAKLPIL
jgi:hypothetical protein